MFNKRSYVHMPARDLTKTMDIATQIAYDDGICEGEIGIFNRIAAKCATYNNSCRRGDDYCPFCIGGEVCYFAATTPLDFNGAKIVDILAGGGL